MPPLESSKLKTVFEHFVLELEEQIGQAISAHADAEIVFDVDGVVAGVEADRGCAEANFFCRAKEAAGNFGDADDEQGCNACGPHHVHEDGAPLVFAGVRIVGELSVDSVEANESAPLEHEERVDGRMKSPKRFGSFREILGGRELSFEGEGPAEVPVRFLDARSVSPLQLLVKIEGQGHFCKLTGGPNIPRFGKLAAYI